MAIGNIKGKEELQAINRAARALTELISGKKGYRNLYNDLRIEIEKNEVEIFKLIESNERNRVHKVVEKVL